MTRSSFLVLALSLVGCGGGRQASSACANLITCCASGLPNGVGNACGELANSTDESACSAALSAIQAASYCQGVSTEKGPAESSHPCTQYLSCLLATAPDDYAAALQLYGSGSACWANAAQTAGCDEACTSSFADIATSCACTGDSCTACTAPTAGTYEATGVSSTTCGTTLDLAYIDVSSIITDQMATVTVQTSDASLSFTGTFSCNGPSTFIAASQPDGSCESDVTLTLTPAAAQGTFVATISASVAAECSQTGEAASCTASVTVMR